jgi:hypothetical protein
MRTLWVGVREEDVLCGSERGHDTITRMRERSIMIEFEGKGLQAIQRDGETIGFGLVCARIEDGEPTPESDTKEQLELLQRVQRVFHRMGIGGKMTINLERTGSPQLPMQVSR